MKLDKKECFSILDKYIKVDDISFWQDTFNNTDYNRFASPFQIYSYKEKLKQYYFTSLNVRLGSALEEIVKTFLIFNGAIYLPRRQEQYDFDQLFTYNNKIVLIEQKLKDDHDSSKEKGQVDNYLLKKLYLQTKYSPIISCSWFIDSNFHKNYKYYCEHLPKEELFYGDEIESFLRLVFGDNRCNGFVNNLIKCFIDYSISLKMENIIINYKELSPKAIYNLLADRFHQKDIGECFFGGIIPYKNIYEDLKRRRKSIYVERSLELIKEYINE